MQWSGLFVQLLNGLAQASSLFLVAAGLSLIFGVSRIVNFAHGSLYMLGIYVAYGLMQWWGPEAGGFWGAIVVSSLLLGLLGVLLEVSLLRRIYQAPELFQLLATFALVLIINDLCLAIWGAEDLLGPLAPGLEGAISIGERYFPEYDMLLIVLGPVVLGVLHLVLNRTRWGVLVRAATLDRQMLSALGVNQAWLFTAVFALGAMLAGFGGALQIPRQPANLGLDLNIIGDVFVVVVVGGLGSLTGAYLAAVLVSTLQAVCIALGTVSLFGIEFAFPKLTLVLEFLFMAVVLVLRPWGLLGKPQAHSRNSAPVEAPLRPATSVVRVLLVTLVLALVAAPLLFMPFPYLPILVVDILIAVLFAVSLHFLMGPGGMNSFGHAAYFGLGAYAAALVFKLAGFGMGPAMIVGPLFAAFAALVFGWFCIRLSGVYLAMLTLAFAQIVWSVMYQWDSVTGGSNGLFGIWPVSSIAGTPFYYLVLIVVVLAAFLVRRILFSPFGYAMRASRDSPVRAQAVGIPVRHVQWLVFVFAGLLAGVAGALFVFSKGSVSPEVVAISKSVDGLLMVLLGGVQTMLGPLVGATVFSLLHDYFLGLTEYWRALFGLVILALVLLFPKGIAGYLGDRLKGFNIKVRS